MRLPVWAWLRTLGEDRSVFDCGLEFPFLFVVVGAALLFVVRLLLWRIVP